MEDDRNTKKKKKKIFNNTLNFKAQLITCI